MIALKSHGKTALHIKESSLDKILSIYPDESLTERQVFVEARQTKEISFSDLKKECETLSLPWQLFLLKPEKLDKEIAELDKLRKSKFEDKFIASRDNEGKGVALRIADRLIALQDFARTVVDKNNDFCGSLTKIPDHERAGHILSYFDIDPESLSSGQKEKTLGYIIKQLEKKNVRVSRGVMNSNKLLPIENNIRSTYRKSSGFVVKDNKVPYIFLPSEINDNETPGRQILTLFALLTMIGLEQYNVYIDGEFETRIRESDLLKQAFGIASEVLLPVVVTEQLEEPITDSVRDELAEKYMLTPSAIVLTLQERGLIQTKEELQELLESIQRKPESSGASHKRTPNIDTSVKKLCGEATCADIIDGVRTDKLTGVRAQYLMFGYVDKLKFEKFKANVGL
ncbi:hypothetical protein EKI60_02650 [Candidatus Saccharibacteria bacterium]|nr:MAG: hypothetical protein EKI60_02650 [Candidatus Saccharibacteria bacterium]